MSLIPRTVRLALAQQSSFAAAVVHDNLAFDTTIATEAGNRIQRYPADNTNRNPQLLIPDFNVTDRRPWQSAFSSREDATVFGALHCSGCGRDKPNAAFSRSTNYDRRCDLCHATNLAGGGGYFLYPSRSREASFRGGARIRNTKFLDSFRAIHAQREAAVETTQRRTTDSAENEKHERLADEFDALIRSLYRAKTRARDLRALNHKLSLLIAGGDMGSAKVQGGKIPGAVKWRAQNNLLYNAKHLHKLAGHWAMSQSEANRCVPGWKPREKKVMCWLLRNNAIFRELKVKLQEIPDVSADCSNQIHIIAKDRGVVAVVNPSLDSYLEGGGRDRVVLSCDGNSARQKDEKIDYTESFQLKTLLNFPLLFPTGLYPQHAPPTDFFNMTERRLLYEHPYQRMRGPLYGYVFQELLVTMRLQILNPAINRYEEDAPFKQRAARNLLLPESVMPSGTLAIRRARGDAFFFHRRAGAGHFFVTATAYLSDLARVFSLSDDDFWSLYPNAAAAVERKNIEALRESIRGVCAGEDDDDQCYADTIYRDVVAINAAFRVFLTGMLLSMDEIRRIQFVYGSFEFQCRGLIHFHGVVRFILQTMARHAQHLQGDIRLQPSKESFDSPETIDLEFSASRWSSDPEEQDLINRLQQHNCSTGGCGAKKSVTRWGKETFREYCRRGYPEVECNRTHYAILPGEEQITALRYKRCASSTRTVVRHVFISALFGGHTCTKLLEGSSCPYYCFKYCFKPTECLVEGVADKDDRSGTAGQRQKRFHEAAVLKQRMAITGPEAAWDLLYGQRFFTSPQVDRYPDDFEPRFNGKPMQLQFVAKEIEKILDGVEPWKDGFFGKKTTCTQLECYWAHRLRNPHQEETIETFLETKVCEASWRNEFQAPLEWNVWIRPPVHFRACYFKVTERSSAGDGAPGPPAAPPMVRISKDNDADHDDSWCLYHLSLLPKKVWSWQDLEEAGSLCALASEFGIQTAKRQGELYRHQWEQYFGAPLTTQNDVDDPLAMWQHGYLPSSSCQKLSKEQLDIINTIRDSPAGSRHVLLARAGRGKTALLRCLLALMANSAATAITHAAAKHLQTVSLHRGVRLGKLEVGSSLPADLPAWRRRLPKETRDMLALTRVLVVDEIFMAHGPWLQSVTNMISVMAPNARLVVAGDDAQCIPVVTKVDTGSTGMTCDDIAVLSTIDSAQPEFERHELTYAWRFKDDEPWGDFVDTLATGTAGPVAISRFEHHALDDAVLSFDPSRGPPVPVLAALRSTCRVVNDAFLAKYPAPHYTSHAVVYAGTDLLVASLMDIPFEVERELPIVDGAIYSMIEGAHAMKLQAQSSGRPQWVHITKHTKLRLVWADENHPALRMSVMDDEGKPAFDVELPKRTWTKETTDDLSYKIIQFPLRLGFCTTIHSSQGSTYDEFYHALPCHLKPLTPTLQHTMRAVRRKNLDDPDADYTEEDHYTADEFFEHGMGYTLYSRCRTGAGVRVLTIGSGECPRHLRYRVRPNFFLEKESAGSEEKFWNPLGMGMEDPMGADDLNAASGHPEPVNDHSSHECEFEEVSYEDEVCEEEEEGEPGERANWRHYHGPKDEEGENNWLNMWPPYGGPGTDGYRSKIITRKRRSEDAAETDSGREDEDDLLAEEPPRQRRKRNRRDHSSAQPHRERLLCDSDSEPSDCHSISRLDPASIAQGAPIEDGQPEADVLRDEHSEGDAQDAEETEAADAEETGSGGV